MSLFCKDFLFCIREIFKTIFRCITVVFRFAMIGSVFIIVNCATPAYILGKLDIESRMFEWGLIMLWLTFSLPITASLAYAYMEYRKRKQKLDKDDKDV